MKYGTICTAIAAVFLAVPVNAQTYQRHADIRGGGNPGGGKCTVEVVVDGAAQVEIRGDTAVLRNLKGQPPQWRRFECSSPMPPNAPGFRFAGVDGRGRQQLLHDAQQGGTILVEIEDPDNGSDTYKFDVTWGMGGPGMGGPGPVSGGPYPGYRGGDGRRDRRFTADQAVQLCQDTVRRQTADRFRTNDVTFRQTNIDDAPGRNDWVIGTLEARRPDRPDQILKFSCSVDFDSGTVRSAQVEPFYAEGGGGPRRDDRVDARGAAVRNCQRAVEDRVKRDGYTRVEFGDARFDDQPGRNDWVVGEFRAAGRYGPESLRFSCSVDLRDGDVRSVDVTTRQR